MAVDTAAKSATESASAGQPPRPAVSPRDLSRGEGIAQFATVTLMSMSA
jgi:hypothetical protein